MTLLDSQSTTVKGERVVVNLLDRGLSADSEGIVYEIQAVHEKTDTVKSCRSRDIKVALMNTMEAMGSHIKTMKSTKRRKENAKKTFRETLTSFKE